MFEQFGREFRLIVTVGVLGIVAGCSKHPVAQENRELVIEKDSHSVLREVPDSSQSAAQKRKIEGQYDGPWARSLTSAMPGNDAESGIESAQTTAEELMTEKAAAFAESDPDGGLEWAKKLPTQSQRDSALESLAWACATTDLAVSVEALEQLPSGAARSRLVAHIVGQWAASNPDDAQSWAESRPDAAESAIALESFAIAIAKEQPNRAAAIVADKMDPGPAQDRAVVAVIQRWVQSDRNAAEQWVSQFANIPLKAAAVAVITGKIPPDPPAVDTKLPAKDSQAR